MIHKFICFSTSLSLNLSVQDEDELGGSILDRNNEAKAMLKIAGRDLHSEGFVEMNKHE